jgi:hypothetical protein
MNHHHDNDFSAAHHTDGGKSQRAGFVEAGYSVSMDRDRDIMIASLSATGNVHTHWQGQPTCPQADPGRL